MRDQKYPCGDVPAPNLLTFLKISDGLTVNLKTSYCWQQEIKT